MLPRAALELVWALEARGIRLSLRGELLHFSPKARLTDEDCVAIRTWRMALRDIVEFKGVDGLAQ